MNMSKVSMFYEEDTSILNAILFYAAKVHLVISL